MGNISIFQGQNSLIDASKRQSLKTHQLQKKIANLHGKLKITTQVQYWLRLREMIGELQYAVSNRIFFGGTPELTLMVFISYGMGFYLLCNE